MKGEAPDPNTSRVGYMYSKNYLGGWATHSNNKKYWDTIQVLKEIGEQIGS